MPYTARCRIAIGHSRSALARLGVALRAAGAEPVSIDFHRTDQSHDLVDLVIELPLDVNHDRLALLLAETGGGRLVAYLPPPIDADPVLGILSQCCDLLAGGDDAELDRRAGAAIAGVCGTRRAIVSGLPQALAHEAARFAVERRGPVVQRARHLPLEISGHSIKEGWLLAVADTGSTPSRVALVARALAEPFLPTEIARVEAIMAIRRRIVARTASEAVTVPA
jgi:hypothetical protein